jgi:polar amino acid transport system substrate-binding protein
MKKISCIVFSFLFVFVLLAGCGQKESNTLVVGMELAYPPFETKDDAGNPTGVSVDLAYALGEYLGREVHIENVNWDGLIPSLQTGKVDIVISSMTATEDRAKVVDFSIPYAHSYLALLVNKESGIQSIEDLYDNDRVIAVKKGTTGYIFATTFLTDAKVHSFTSENACVTEVMQGKADAFIYDQLTIYRQNQSHLDTTEAILIPFQEGENWAMAVKSGNSDLLQQVNQFIEIFINDGGFEVITEKYLQKEKEIFDSLGFPWFFSE